MFDLACDSDPNGVQLHKVPMQSLNDKDIFPSAAAPWPWVKSWCSRFSLLTLSQQNAPIFQKLHGLS